MKAYTYILLLVSGCLALSAHPAVAADSADKALTRLATAVKAQDTQLCGSHLTRSSQAYCDRFIGYGLLPCVPTQVTRESEKAQGKHTLLRVRVDDAGSTPRYARLAFIKESGKWKLDVPHSLKTAFGSQWEKRTNLLEQVYLVMRAQWGDEISCDKLKTMVDKSL